MNTEKHRAILDAFLPEWRLLADLPGSLWNDRWIAATGEDRTSAWRWRRRALEILAAESQIAA